MKELLAESPSGEDFLRLTVEAGGCSGFSYKFDLGKGVEPTDRSSFACAISLRFDAGIVENNLLVGRLWLNGTTCMNATGQCHPSSWSDTLWHCCQTVSVRLSEWVPPLPLMHLHASGGLVT